jgi:intracellular multiplication protein IcmX
MATWRLYNPSSSSTGSTTQWVDQINTASSATVQKEIAVLLSEINYQMYLTRQQEERLLLTNSLQLIQSMIASKPAPPSSSTNTTDTSS